MVDQDQIWWFLLALLDIRFQMLDYPESPAKKNFQWYFKRVLFQYPPGKCEIDVRLRSFSQNGMIRNGRPRSDCFVASEAHKSFSYSQADTAMESSLTSSPSSEPLIPGKGWSKEKKTVVFVNLSRENSLFSSSSSSELFTHGKVWDHQKNKTFLQLYFFEKKNVFQAKKFPYLWCCRLCRTKPWLLYQTLYVMDLRMW